jgi:predicted aspartyl protease
MGFFPMPDNEVEALATHLRLGAATDKAKDFTLLDPCAGRGDAIRILADSLHVPYRSVYMVELDKARGETCRRNMPGANVLAPCSLFSTLISHRAFSMALVNPPYDDELGGGGRDETTFIKEAYNLLCENGVIVLVAPLKIYLNNDIRCILDSHWKDTMLYRFSEPKYNEVVMIGRRRSSPLEDKDVYHRGRLKEMYGLDRYDRKYDYARSRYCGINDLRELPALGTIACDWKAGCPDLEQHKTIKVWDVPPSWRPSRFAKAGYLPEELIEEIGKSANNNLYRAAREPDIAEAPLPLAEGHVALLVTSGALDGLIEVPGHPELTHVMRGIARKVEKPNEEASSCSISEDGKSMKVREVYSEEQDTKIRAIDKSFRIFDFTLRPAKETRSRETDVQIEATDGSGTVVVPLIREGDSDYVMIDCGGGKQVRFCFDTGAEVCTIGTDQLKGVEYFATGRTTAMQGVGGHVSTCKEILIAEMSVEGLLARNVRCLVVEGTGSATANTLLGQNFLRLFDYAYSQRNATLSLTLAEKDDESEAA